MSAARHRHRALARIEAVQAQKHRLEEWRLADLDRRLRETDAAEAALIEALNGDSPFHGLFVDQAARRLDMLGARKRLLQDARTAQSGTVQAEARRAKAAEKLCAVAARLAEEERRRVADLDILDAFLARRDDGASLA